jgi:drug/metabolite transporter (DMT)-like permease
MLLAAQSMAVGTVMVRWVQKYVDPVMATGWHMVVGGIPLLLLSAHNEPALYSHVRPHSHPHPQLPRQSS